LIPITMMGAFFTITRTVRTGCTSATPSIPRRPSASEAGNTKLREDNVSAVVTKKSGFSAMRIHCASES
jgi:hypothetical protein